MWHLLGNLSVSITTYTRHGLNHTRHSIEMKVLIDISREITIQIMDLILITFFKIAARITSLTVVRLLGVSVLIPIYLMRQILDASLDIIRNFPSLLTEWVNVYLFTDHTWTRSREFFWSSDYTFSQAVFSSSLHNKLRNIFLKKSRAFSHKIIFYKILNSDFNTKNRSGRAKLVESADHYRKNSTVRAQEQLHGHRNIKGPIVQTHPPKAGDIPDWNYNAQYFRVCGARAAYYHVQAENRAQKAQTVVLLHGVSCRSSIEIKFSRGITENYSDSFNKSEWKIVQK